MHEKATFLTRILHEKAGSECRILHEKATNKCRILHEKAGNKHRFLHEKAGFQAERKREHRCPRLRIGGYDKLKKSVYLLCFRLFSSCSLPTQYGQSPYLQAEHLPPQQLPVFPFLRLYERARGVASATATRATATMMTTTSRQSITCLSQCRPRGVFALSCRHRS